MAAPTQSFAVLLQVAPPSCRRQESLAQVLTPGAILNVSGWASIVRDMCKPSYTTKLTCMATIYQVRRVELWAAAA
jgi:hypothetical protein